MGSRRRDEETKMRSISAGEIHSFQALFSDGVIILTRLAYAFSPRSRFKPVIDFTELTVTDTLLYLEHFIAQRIFRRKERKKKF